MKKIYCNPTTRVFNVNTQKSLLVNISVNNNSEIDSNKAGLVKQDSGWDLWGDDNDFDN